LEQSWTTAVDEWLAGVKAKAGSHDAYPHLKNLESQLARLDLAFSEYQGPGADPLLRPAEAYVLLMSILLHVIGRTQQKEEDGTAAYRIITKNYAELGIRDRHLARIIARICRCHSRASSARNPYDDKQLREQLAQLTTRAIDPYGEIREHSCAALLILLDSMDTSFRRVAPEYSHADVDLGTAAQFRRHTGDVVADLRGRVVKVVLGDEFDALKCPDEPHADTPMPSSSPWESPPPPPFVLMDGLDELGRSIEHSTRLLNTLHPVLSATGIFLRGWVVQHRDHLFTYRGKLARSSSNPWAETHEPGLSTSYLRRITETMWALSTQVFGEGFFSYEALADAMREPEPDRARRAVHRIATVAARVDPKPLFWTSRTHWRWLLPPEEGRASARPDAYHALRERLLKLESSSAFLSEPPRDV